ncbi:MAG: leucyl aminopeptidase family protein [Pseudomonadota bacterium]
MTECLLDADAGPTVPVHALRGADWGAFATAQPARVMAAAAAGQFTAAEGQRVLVPDAHGGVERVLFGLGEPAVQSAMAFRDLSASLPPGDYRILGPVAGCDPTQLAVAWALGAYRFDRYKQERAGSPPRLAPPPGAAVGEARLLSHACAMARDMINTPASDMGPRQVETIAREIAEAFGATMTVTAGDALIEAGYPAVHAVGRAAVAERAPRMIEIRWGEAARPLVALVGKGVVFDTGGLDIKPSAGMALMKKDMGGAAHALALARLIMAAALPVSLAVLIPVAENAIAGDAMRPGDVLASRKGLTIEVGNTDAEGRLILADALARAAELSPHLTIDLATLTGAARVALGPQVAPFYTADDELAAALAAAAQAVDDPVWRMPLWEGYASALDSDIADIRNDSDPWAQAGSITAALFLRRFAPSGPWIHFDIFAWNPRARPGWPRGAEVQAIRALFAMLKARYR